MLLAKILSDLERIIVYFGENSLNFTIIKLNFKMDRIAPEGLIFRLTMGHFERLSFWNELSIVDIRKVRLNGGKLGL